MNAKTLAEFRVGHGAALEDLLIGSFAGLVIAGVASLDRVARRRSASAGAASFRPAWKTAGEKRRKRYAVFKKKPHAIPARRAGARPRRDCGRRRPVRGAAVKLEN